jgi:hypothetical protein
MLSSYKLFIKSKNYSLKWQKYFDVYDIIFKKFRKKKITFVEVGVLNGGSLEIWKKYFHPKSRIIGIDLNPKCKKFQKSGIEIIIGDQSDENFWNKFYKKVGKIDILLDDGGHTNKQQIITTLKSIPNINDGGVVIIEDTHTSYMKNFGNPNKYSFINFTKKLIDDINYKFTDLGNFKVSLNDYIYSIQYFESFVVFHINAKKTTYNNIISNKFFQKKDFRDTKLQDLVKKKLLLNKIIYKFKFLSKYSFAILIYKMIINKISYLKNIFDIIKYKKFFK